MKTNLTLYRNVPVVLTQAVLDARKAVSLPTDVTQALIGQLLGDAYAYRSSPTANTRIEWSFGALRQEYAEYIANMMSLYCNISWGLRPLLASSNYRLKTVALSLFNSLHDMFYVQDAVTGKYNKVVPVMINDLMTPIVLAHLIMGDGNFHGPRKTVRIYTNAFTYDDCVRLAAAITNMGIVTSVHKDRIGANGEQQYLLAIGNPELNKLRTIVAPYMHKSMLYRLGL